MVPLPEAGSDRSVWTAKDDSVTLPGWLGIPGIRHSIGLARWWHFSITLLWMINGIAFYALLFATDQWLRLVPTTWEVIPECGVDRAAIFIAHVPRRTELDALQQPATNRLFHHRVHSRAYVHPDGVHAKSGDFKPAWVVRQGAKPAESAFNPFSGIVVVLTFHPRARDAGVHHRRAGEPQYDVRRGE